jgi:hypothetical protein
MSRARVAKAFENKASDRAAPVRRLRIVGDSG